MGFLSSLKSFAGPALSAVGVATANPLLVAGGSAVTSAFGATQQNKAARGAAQTQMDFQERMSSTSYQRAMADMRLAGLNPILAYQRGGATTPSGAQPNVVNPAGTELAGLTNSALRSRQIEADVKLKNAQTRLNKLQGDLTGPAMDKLRAEAQYAKIKTEMENQFSGLLRGNTELQWLHRNQAVGSSALGLAAMALRSGGRRALTKFRPKSPRSGGKTGSFFKPKYPRSRNPETRGPR